MRVFVLFASLLLSPIAVNAGNLDISVNDDAARLGFGWYANHGRLAMDLSWLHHQDAGNAFGLGLNVMGLASNSDKPIEVGLGGRLVYTNPKSLTADGGALAPGGFVSYNFPDANRFTIYGHIYFAPSVLGFGDVDQYRELELRLYYSVIDDADLFIGLRNIYVKYDTSQNFNFDTGFHAGLKIRF